MNCIYASAEARPCDIRRRLPHSSNLCFFHDLGFAACSLVATMALFWDFLRMCIQHLWVTLLAWLSLAGAVVQFYVLIGCNRNLSAVSMPPRLLRFRGVWCAHTGSATLEPLVMPPEHHCSTCLSADSGMSIYFFNLLNSTSTMSLGPLISCS